MGCVAEMVEIFEETVVTVVVVVVHTCGEHEVVMVPSDVSSACNSLKAAIVTATTGRWITGVEGSEGGNGGEGGWRRIDEDGG